MIVLQKHVRKKRLSVSRAEETCVVEMEEDGLEEGREACSKKNIKGPSQE